MDDQNSRMPETGRSGSASIGGDGFVLDEYGLLGSACRRWVREVVELFLKFSVVVREEVEVVGEASGAVVRVADLSERDLDGAGVARDVAAEDEVCVEALNSGGGAPGDVPDLRPIAEEVVGTESFNAVTEDVPVDEVLEVLLVEGGLLPCCAGNECVTKLSEGVESGSEGDLVPTVEVDGGWVGVDGETAGGGPRVDCVGGVVVEAESLVTELADEIGVAVAKGRAGLGGGARRSARTRLVGTVLGPPGSAWCTVGSAGH